MNRKIVTGSEGRQFDLRFFQFSKLFESPYVVETSSLIDPRS